MNPRFRLVLFVPNPFNGMSWPLGAMVETKAGVQVARSGRLPDATALGSQLTAQLAQRLHGRMDECSDFEKVPISFGPYVVLSEVRALPAGVADPVGWIELHILPRAIPVEGAAA